VSGDWKCGRTNTVTAMRAARNATSVTAIAGSTLRVNVPAKTPSATANSV